MNSANPEKNIKRTGVGSLIQLSAVGPQDVHIHYGNEDNEARTYGFETSFVQHTRFAMDFSSVYNLKPFNPYYGGKLKFEVPFEKQHMISSVILKIDLPTLEVPPDATGIHYKNKLGYRLIKSVKFKINNEIIEQYTGQYLYILHKLETHEGHKQGVALMMSDCQCEDLLNGDGRTLLIHLPLWYSRTMQQFFPLLAFHRQKIYIEIEFEDIAKLVVCENAEHVVNVTMNVTKSGHVNIQCSDSTVVVDKHIHGDFYIDYVKLDNIERDIYLKTRHADVYNLVLLQDETVQSNNMKVQLHFNIPIKQLVFVITTESELFEFYTFTNARLLLGNTQATMDLQDAHYYKLVQKYYHNLCIPEEDIYSYSFALNASITEHNGAIHFGKLENKIFEINDIITNYIDTKVNQELIENQTSKRRELENIFYAKTHPSYGSIRLVLHVYARGYNVLHTNQGYGKVEFKA